MKLKSKTSLTLVALLTSSVLGVFGYKSYVEFKYNEALTKINEVDGVSVSNSSFDTNFFSSTATATSVISIDKAKLSFLEFGLNISDQVKLEVKHNINYLTYPLEIKHELYFDEAMSKIATDFLGVPPNQADRFMLPIQALSLHSFDSSTFLGMTDHIKFGEFIEVSPVRIKASLFDQGIAIYAAGKRAFAQSSTSMASLSADDFAVQWSGELFNCLAVCTGYSEINAAKIEQYSDTGMLELEADNLNMLTSSSLKDGLYRFTLGTTATSIKTPLMHWTDFDVFTATDDIKSAAIEKFEADYKALLGNSEMNYFAQANLKSLYARFLESGMSIQIEKAKAMSPFGPIDGSFSVHLPVNSMPDMVNNPLGLIKVIDADLKLKMPTKEYENLLGFGSSQQIIQAGFAVSSKDNAFLETDISISKGLAEINGKQVSL